MWWGYWDGEAGTSMAWRGLWILGWSSLRSMNCSLRKWAVDIMRLKQESAEWAGCVFLYWVGNMHGRQIVVSENVMWISGGWSRNLQGKCRYWIGFGRIFLQRIATPENGERIWWVWNVKTLSLSEFEWIWERDQSTWLTLCSIKSADEESFRIFVFIVALQSIKCFIES